MTIQSSYAIGAMKCNEVPGTIPLDSWWSFGLIHTVFGGHQLVVIRYT